MTAGGAGEKRIYMNILKRIDDLRKSRNISFYELAKRSGIAANTFYRWYSKGYTPTLDSVKAICEKGFSISLAEFFACESNLIELNEETKNLLEQWTTLTAKQKEVVLELIKSYKEN